MLKTSKRPLSTFPQWDKHWQYTDGLMQERRNSIAKALELRFSCTNPFIYSSTQITTAVWWTRKKIDCDLKSIPTSLNSLWPSDAIWQHRSGSTLVHVMPCCLMAPSHYPNQCWLIISKTQCHSSEGNITRDTYLSHQSLRLAWKLLV